MQRHLREILTGKLVLAIRFDSASNHWPAGLWRIENDPAQALLWHEGPGERHYYTVRDGEWVLYTANITSSGWTTGGYNPIGITPQISGERFVEVDPARPGA